MFDERIVMEVHSLLVEAAKTEEKLVQYKMIIETANLKRFGEGIPDVLGKLFYEVNEYDRNFDIERPMLSAIAVSINEQPSKGFFDLARHYGKFDGKNQYDELTFWITEMEELRKYWSSHDAPSFRNIDVTFEVVVQALRQFDSDYPESNMYKSWLDRNTYKYAIDFNGKLYPPKHILYMVTGVETTHFSGGDETNRVFEKLGFTIVNKNNYASAEDIVEEIWHQYLSDSHTGNPNIDDDKEITRYQEGTRVKITSYRYERDSKARQACLEYFGTNCSVCDFDFGMIYGGIGEGFIHVHHLVPISERDTEYSVDPKEDLRPVCPNCHAMLHRTNPPYTIEELKSVIKSD